MQTHTMLVHVDCDKPEIQQVCEGLVRGNPAYKRAPSAEEAHCLITTDPLKATTFVSEPGKKSINITTGRLKKLLPANGYSYGWRGPGESTEALKELLGLLHMTMDPRFQ